MLSVLASPATITTLPHAVTRSIRSISQREKRNDTMPCGVDQIALPLYRGRFSFNEAQLTTYIKEHKPDYEHHDPKTWMVVTADLVEAHLGYPYSGQQLLPPGVAYERSLVFLCIGQHADRELDIERTDGYLSHMKL